jgi:arylsulfatase A-like enzyme
VIPPGSVHLFDVVPSRIERADQELSPALAERLGDDEVWVLDETIPVANVRHVPLGPGGLKYRVHDTRFAACGPSRIVPFQEASAPAGAASGERLPDEGEVRIGASGVTLGRGRYLTIADRLPVSYRARSVDVRGSVLAPRARAGDRLAANELELGPDTRRAWSVPQGSRVSWSLALGEGARLRAGCALRALALEARGNGVHVAQLPGTAGVTFQIELGVDGTRESVFSRTVAVYEAGLALDVDVDLSAWAGSVVELTLAVTSETGEAGDRLVTGAWLEPTVSSEQQAGASRPDIVVLLLDTLRADRLGCYGWERARTPNLDALAERGVLFLDATAAAPWTLPSHASLFSSLYPSEHAMWNDEHRLAARVETVAEVLRDEGYATAAFSEGGYVRPSYGFAQGFDRFVVGPLNVRTTFDVALRWTATAPEPFLLFVQTYQVHSPYDPPSTERAELVRPYAGELTERVHPPDHPWGRTQFENTLGPDDVRYIEDLYDAEIAYLDREVGRLCRELERLGKWENTLFVVTSDHGEELADHGHFGHGFSLYREQLHVPLILHQPGVFEGGGIARHPVHGLDLAPTLARAAGARHPAAWRGTPLALEPGEGSRTIVVPHFVRDRGDRALCVRDGSLKFIDFPPDGRVSDPVMGPGLFDLGSDNSERTNLWEDADRERWNSFAERFWAEHPELDATDTARPSASVRQDLKDLGYAGD